MTHSAKPPAPSPNSYHGGVWTNSRGYAAVRLPAGAVPLEPPLKHALRDLEPPRNARITAGLENGRFTLATEQPHVKVAWRITGRPPAGQPDREKEEKR
jgi:hypothetical protein